MSEEAPTVDRLRQQKRAPSHDRPSTSARSTTATAVRTLAVRRIPLTLSVIAPKLVRQGQFFRMGAWRGEIAHLDCAGT